MKNIKLIEILSLILAAFVLLSSCGKKDDSDLRWGFTTEPRTLNPLNPANSADGRSILFNVFEGLVKPNTDGTFAPCIAESWTIEQGGLVYNFILREGILFHDGSALTASDIKFSLDTAIAANYAGLNNIKETLILDNNKISVILKTADPEFLPYLTIGIVKEEITDHEINIIGTGPFIIESYTPQRNLVLKKFDNYWQPGLPNLDKITIVFFANFDTLMVALRGGSIDGAFITGAMAAQLDHREFDIFNNRSAAIQLLALNNAKGALEDIRVRKAINHGVDIKGIINTAFFGHGSPSGSPVIPGLRENFKDNLSYPHNIELAQSYLNQAGYNDTNRLSLEITVPSNFTMHVDTAQVIASQLDQIGIKTSIKLVDWDTWLEDVYTNMNYEATIISLDSPIVSARSFLTRYLSDNRNNFINYKNPDFDRVYNLALTETDREKRINLYKDAQIIITEDAASVFIQDILYFIALSGGKYAGALDYPLYVIDLSSIYRISK